MSERVGVNQEQMTDHAPYPTAGGSEAPEAIFHDTSETVTEGAGSGAPYDRLAPPNATLLKTWEVSAYDKKLQEWTTTYNRSFAHANPFESWQATPADIRPTRKKGVKRDHKTIAVFGDMQAGYRRIENPATGEIDMIPIHDERAMKVARYIMRDLMPDTIVNLSDSVDLPELGRFDKDSDHFWRTLTPAFQRVHDYYGELRADNPDAHIVEVASNHNERLAKYVLKNTPDMYGMRRAGADSSYPVLTYPYLANLERADVEWKAGYPGGEFIYGEDVGDPIIFRHGTESSSNGTTASKIMKNFPETHNIHGHSHKIESAFQTLRSGKYLGSFAVGALCRTDGVVPSYHSSIDDSGLVVPGQEKWQNGIMVINDYGKGVYEFQQIPIKEGVAHYNGRRYDASNSFTITR